MTRTSLLGVSIGFTLAVILAGPVFGTEVKRILYEPDLATAPAGAKTESRWVQLDPAYPSGGSGYEGPIPGPRTVLMDVPLGAEADALLAGPPEGEHATLSPASSLSFAGQGQLPTLDGFQYKPPDTHIAVGTGSGASGRIVAVTNSGIAIYDKTGATIAAATDLDTFVSTTAGGFDPKVLFDQHSGRFFVVVLDGKTPNPGGTSNLHIAVSGSSTPNNLTTDWTAFVQTALTNLGGTETWFDYPGIGADAVSLYVTGNMFDTGGSYVGTKIRHYHKANLIAGTQTVTDLDINNTAYFTMQPAHVFGTTDSGNFYLINRLGSTQYILSEITGAPAAPALVAGTFDTARTWAAGAFIGDGAPQSGVTGILISTLSSRVMNAVYRNGSVWCCLSADVDSDSKTEAVWFEVNTNGGNPSAPTVAQSGYLDGSDGDEWTFMPSIAVDANDNALICYSQSFTDQFVGMRVAARENTDPANSFQISLQYKASVGEYDDFNSPSTERWGDYSAAVSDPDDDLTFWVANEYVSTGRTVAGGDAAWGTWIAQTGIVIPVPVELSHFAIE